MSRARALFIFLPIALLFFDCYTSFTHPPIKQSEWGNVRVSDDCTECHNSQRFAAPILPRSAEQDYSWQFYSGSAWWEDDYSASGVAVSPDNTTGPRTVSPTQIAPAPVAMPVQGGQSLGKQSAPAETEKKTDNKRTINRRSNTSSSSDTSKEAAPSRSRDD